MNNEFDDIFSNQKTNENIEIKKDDLFESNDFENIVNTESIKNNDFEDITPVTNNYEKNIEEVNPSENTTEDEGFSILKSYGENLTSKTYITNPAIAREEEIKKMILILLSPEKSVVLTGKAGIGKTSIVEGLGYRIERDDVPNALKKYEIVKINTSSLLGTYVKDGIEESKLQTLISEVMGKENMILFIDEIHTLVTASRNGEVDFINMLKPGLDRGTIKIIGATTTQEYEEFLLKDKAFLRRFERIEIAEPDQETTVKICMGTVKKIEHATGVKFPYTNWILELVCKFIVNMTSEYKRVYENGSRYPDVSLALLSKCFTYARFENSEYVTFKHIYEAIKNCTSVYDDVIKKEMPVFKETFKEWLDKEKVVID